MSMNVEELLAAGKIHRPTADAWDKVYRLVYEPIAKELRDDEEVKYVISTGAISRKNSSMLFIGAVVITDKRLVYGGQIKGLLKNTYVASAINIKNVMSANTGYQALGTGTVTIETLAHDDISIGFENREKAFDYQREMMLVIDEIKGNSNADNNTTTVVQQVSAADEIKKYKDLADQGIITQEEFEQKKKQLLGL